jgi:hypothetical protein
MSDGPNPGSILIGIFLILCGLCLTFLGGGCTLLWLGQVGFMFSDGGLGLLLFAVSVATLAGGLFLIWFGFGMFGGGRRDGEP